MEEKSVGMKGVIVFLLIFLVLGGLAGYFFYKNYNAQSETNEELINPVSDLNINEAVSQFDSSFVRYLLYSIGAERLHNPPLSSDTPKIEVDVGGEIYNAVVKKGVISVGKGGMDLKDMIITTTKEEAVLMMEDQDYAKESFKSGKSQITLIAGKTSLFLKGYLDLYNQLTEG